MKIDAVENSYARWAPIYDRTFGYATNIGRRRAVDYINKRTGKILEVGVGTGLSLEHYGASQQVWGFDYSAEMLAKAKAKVTAKGLSAVKELRQMDARKLDYKDGSFDTVAAMHVLSVVPEPERVMSEIARVLKPGGQVVITNHFARERGFLAFLERVAAPLENLLGWHSDFKMERILGEETLCKKEEGSLPPLGMMTFLVLEKET